MMHFSEREMEQIRKTLGDRKEYVDRLILELRKESADLETIIHKMDSQLDQEDPLNHLKSEIDHFVNQMFGRQNP